MAKKATTPTSNLSSEKAKAVEAAIAQIEKNYGKGSIMALGQQPVEDIPVIPTGCIQLDMALGVGGFPRGRIIEIYGPESSGKTTLALHAIAEAQKLGGVAAFIDAEHAFDAVYARKLGVDIESLLVSQPDTGEQALDIAKRSCVLAPSTSSSWTPWQRSFRKPKSTAKWVITTWACRLALCRRRSASSPASSPSRTPACCSSTSSA